VAAACYEERDRPGPPLLSITLDQTEVDSPDTLTGRLRATDVDGIDSLWLVVDTTRFGIEGFLVDEIEGPFAVEIPAGRSPGEAIPLILEARDLLGYVSTLDTFVRVAFPLRVAP
jgi:hypothetical protein